MIPVLIDTDPGIDDAMALVYAVRSGALDVRGITTVAGNVPVELGTENALCILAALGRTDIPVARGAAQPILRPYEDSRRVHGDNGLGGVAWPEPRSEPVSLPAPLFLIEQCHRSVEPLTLITLGPLTNVALALASDPRLASRIARIVCMGGAFFCAGNIIPGAEYNFYADPEAARTVMHAGVPLTLVGLDVTMEAIMPPEAFRRLEASASPIARRIGTMGHHLCARYHDWYGLNGTAIHDALAVAAVTDPSLLQTEPYYVNVEIRSELSPGQTVADRRRRTGRPTNAEIAVSVEAERFLRDFEAVAASA